MKVSTNVKPRNKKSTVTTLFKKAEEKAKKKLDVDSQSAKRYDESLKKKGKTFQGKTGRVTNKDLAASAGYTGDKVKGYSETQRVTGLKTTTYYDPKPAVVGGTKKMLKRSKKNVDRSSASKQAKASARKLY